MGLAEALEKTTLQDKKLCPVGRLLKKLSKEDAAALEKAFTNGTSARQIILALRMEGHSCSPESLNNHRKKRCQCEVAK